MLTFTIDTTFVCVGSDHNVKRSRKKLATSEPPISSMFSACITYANTQQSIIHILFQSLDKTEILSPIQNKHKHVCCIGKMCISHTANTATGTGTTTYRGSLGLLLYIYIN